MRRTASAAQRMEPVTLMRNMRSNRSTDISSIRAVGPTMPALLTRPSSRPKAASTAANIAWISVSEPTSP